MDPLPEEFRSCHKLLTLVIPEIYDKYNNVAALQITMHHVRIRSLANKTWMELPYMVADEEIDLLISLWPLAWKKGLTNTPGETIAPHQPASVIAEPRGNPLQPPDMAPA